MYDLIAERMPTQIHPRTIGTNDLAGDFYIDIFFHHRKIIENVAGDDASDARARAGRAGAGARPQ